MIDQSASFIRVPAEKANKAAKAQIKSIDRKRDREDFGMRQRERYRRLKWHKLIRKITFGLIKVPLYSHDDARRKIESEEFGHWFYPSIVHGLQKSRCYEIIAACEASTDGYIYLSVDDVKNIGL